MRVKLDPSLLESLGRPLDVCVLSPPPLALLHFFADLEDPRVNRTRRHELSDILFCDTPRSVTRPAVFELASGVRLRPYDPKLYRPGTDGPEALRRVVGYGRVLQSLGYLEGATRLPPPRRVDR